MSSLTKISRLMMPRSMSTRPLTLTLMVILPAACPTIAPPGARRQTPWRSPRPGSSILAMTTTTPLSEIISLTDLPWQEHRPGVRAKNIWAHPETTRRAMLVRYEPGAQIALHRHVGDELIFVIEGGVSDESGTVTAGNVGYRPNGCVHSVSSKNGATVLAILTGGVEPATERGAGSPPSQIFTLSDLPWVDTRPGVRQKRIWE